MPCVGSALCRRASRRFAPPALTMLSAFPVRCQARRPRRSRSRSSRSTTCSRRRPMSLSRTANVSPGSRAALERRVPLLIEKPLATDLAQSAAVLQAIENAGLDAVVGYTQRFRRKWLSAKEKVRTGALGDVTLVTSRAFMNRLVAIDNYKRTDNPAGFSPMVISGTHALDIVMWCMEAKTPVECYARSIDKVLGPLYQGIDATAGMIMFADGSVYHLNISWALPVTWPGAVYSLEIGINGTEGVLTIDDTHRDMVLAVSAPQNEGYAPDERRLVDFMGSYPPGDIALCELRGPMPDDTEYLLNRIAHWLTTQAATASEA